MNIMKWYKRTDVINEKELLAQFEDNKIKEDK